MAYEIHDTYGYKIYLDVAESSMMAARAAERYEPNKFKWLQKNLTPKDVFIDVGANKGDFTLLAAMYCDKVYSVEPHPHNIEWLKKSIALNSFMNVDVLEGCATTISGTVDLGIGGKSGHHSIIARRSKSMAVRAFRLDDVIPSKHTQLVVKIDVEGAEKLVLEGMKHIMHNVRAFLIDVDSGDLEGVKKYLDGFEFLNSGREIICCRG